MAQPTELSDVVQAITNLGSDIKSDHNLESRMREVELNLAHLEGTQKVVTTKLDIAMRILVALLLLVAASTLNSIFGFVGV